MICSFSRAAQAGSEKIFHRDSQTQDIQALLLHVQQNLSHKWDRDRLAKEAGLSVSRFHDVFKSVTSKAPAQWLRQARINHAKDLLAHSQQAIHRIASECGFDDPYHFSRVFKSCEGISPRAWRSRI